MRIALIDHYDSFSFNVLAWLAGAADAGVHVERVAFDDAAACAAVVSAHLPLVLSPGPKRPEDAAPTVALVRQQLGLVPIFGVCLGHQILGHLAGAAIVRAQQPLHGAAHRLTVAADAVLLAGCGPHFAAAAYNSLTVQPPHGAAAPPGWLAEAWNDAGELQAMRRIDTGAPAFGVQFHPESFLSEHAERIRANWLTAASTWSQNAVTPTI